MPDGHYDLRIVITDNANNATTSDLPEAMRVVFAQCILALQVGQKGIYS